MESKKKTREIERAKKKVKKKLAKEQGIVWTGPSRKELKKNKIEYENAPFTVAIDLSFDDLMADKNLSSCASQLLRIYTANRRAKRPIPVYFTGLKPGSKMLQKLETHEGSKNWDVVRSEQSFLEIFDRDKIVYLTSESEEVLDKLETGYCYVIGGIVDHNFHKGLTFDMAKKENIKTAKLPLQEHIEMASRWVLTINQCFEILLGVAEGKTWKEIIIETIPQRKMPKLKESKKTSTETCEDDGIKNE
jgi:tRNA (guanine9-N1)-methyltransferase